MATEIWSIPDRIADGLERRASESLDLVAAFRRYEPEQVLVAGRGTSSHAAHYARYLAETQLAVASAEVAPSVWTCYGAARSMRRVVLLAFSQSGQGPDVIEVVDRANDVGALTIAVTNDPTSPLASLAQHCLPLHAGDEQSMAATVTYVAELAAVAWLVAELSGGPSREDIRRLPEEIGRARDVAAASLSEDAIGALADGSLALCIGRGYNLATAEETALKLVEAANVPAIAYSAAGFLHGPLTLASKRTIALAFHATGPTETSVLTAAHAAHDLGARTYTISADRLAGVPWPTLDLGLGLPEALTPIALVVPGQILAERVAARRGLDPDAPRGIASKVVQTT